jgi:NIMA (never in mitosis gene a)-related kinase
MTLALKALHDRNIFHRDLKSANIFQNLDGTFKMGDLNVSKIAQNGMLYTQTGTPYYASPEVWQEKPYNNKSDIWSLGCILYEMCSLNPPFRAKSMNGLYNSVVSGMYPKLPSIYSDELSSIIKLLLQVNPAKRPSCD